MGGLVLVHMSVLRIVLLNASNSDVPVALGHRPELLKLFFGHPLVVMIKHRGGILVLNCTLSSLQLLVFDKFIVSPGLLDIRTVVATMT